MVLELGKGQGKKESLAKHNRREGVSCLFIAKLHLFYFIDSCSFFPPLNFLASLGDQGTYSCIEIFSVDAFFFHGLGGCLDAGMDWIGHIYRGWLIVCERKGEIERMRMCISTHA